MPLKNKQYKKIYWLRGGIVGSIVGILLGMISLVKKLSIRFDTTEMLGGGYKEQGFDIFIDNTRVYFKALFTADFMGVIFFIFEPIIIFTISGFIIGSIINLVRDKLLSAK